MQYVELTGNCKTCSGCNLLEIPFFKGKQECSNYIQTNESGINMCRKILKGEQIKICLKK